MIKRSCIDRFKIWGQGLGSDFGRIMKLVYILSLQEKLWDGSVHFKQDVIRN